MQTYIVMCSTGALCIGCYSSLEAAQQAVQAHFALLGEAGYSVHQWVNTFGNGMQYTHPDSTNGYITDICILKLTLDAPLPVV